MISVRLSIPYCSMTSGSFRMMFRQTKGLTRFAAPTSTAEAPASIISITSSAEDTPPMPMMGMPTAS